MNDEEINVCEQCGQERPGSFQDPDEVWVCDQCQQEVIH